MNREYKDFVEFVHRKYFEIKEKYREDDWEQIYFDTLNIELDTDKTQVLVKMFYWYDDTTGEIAQGVLDMLDGKKLLRYDCFDDEENEATIVVVITEKQGE